MAAVKGSHSGRDARTKGTQHRLRGGFDQGDMQPELAGGGCDLAADEPGADDCDMGAGAQGRCKRTGVVKAAQGMAVIGGACQGKTPGPDAGGRDDPVRADQRAVGQPHIPALDPGRGHAQPHLDLTGRQFRAQHELVEDLGHRGFPLCQRLDPVLGQRRAVVGDMRFVAHERHARPGQLGHQRLGRAQPRERGADDGDARPAHPDQPSTIACSGQASEAASASPACASSISATQTRPPSSSKEKISGAAITHWPCSRQIDMST